MRLLFALTMIVFTAMAEDAPKPAEPKPELMTENEALKVENLRLQEQLLRTSKDNLIVEICTAHKVEIKNCSVNPATGEVLATKTPGPASTPILPNAKPTN